MPRGVGIPGGMITSSGRTKIAVRSDLGPPHARHADDFAPRLKSKKLHKRLLRDITPDDVDAGFHQQRMADAPVPASFSRGSSKALCLPFRSVIKK